MSQTPYQRVDLNKIARQTDAPTEVEHSASSTLLRSVLVVIPLSVLLCVAQAVITILANNVANNQITPTLIPTLGFGVLFLLLLAVSPMMRLFYEAFGDARKLAFAAPIIVIILGARIVMSLPALAKFRGTWWHLDLLVWVLAVIIVLALIFCPMRRFRRAEVMSIFAALLVTAGISTFGLAPQLVPVIATPFNPEWNTQQSGWSEEGGLTNPDNPYRLNEKLYITDAEKIREFRAGIGENAPGEDAPWTEKLAFWNEVRQNIPWSLWIGPISRWLVFVFGCYLMFYSLTYVVLNFWSQREKLIFPLAKLPESMLPEDDVPQYMPRIFTTGMFWLGFGISFTVLYWNAVVSAQWFDGVGRMPLGMSAQAVTTLVTGTAFHGIQPTTQFFIIFTAVGIAFLLPLEISFSIWFYYLVGRFIILTMTWLGYGTTMKDFPTDWMWMNSPITALGGGGMFLFSGVAMWRCIAEYRTLVRGKTAEQRFKIFIPVIGLGVSLLVVTVWVSNNMGGLQHVLWALAFMLVAMLLTVGLMRIVAEGGIYWLQSHTSFFHVYKMLGLGKFLAPIVVGPLLMIYYVLFLDLKTFIAPNMLNAAKLREDTRGDRTVFHVNIILNVVVSVVVSLATAIYLSYLRGAQQMQQWFYSVGPKINMDDARSATTMPIRFEPTTTTWFVLGGGWVALTMFLRRSVFWFPHPVGFIMLINPLMDQLWFSFLIGWVFKRLVVQYGGKATFDKVRLAFIGLIMGELIAIFMWVSISLIYNYKFANIPLHRYTP